MGEIAGVCLEMRGVAGVVWYDEAIDVRPVHSSPSQRPAAITLGSTEDGISQKIAGLTVNICAFVGASRSPRSRLRCTLRVLCHWCLLANNSGVESPFFVPDRARSSGC